MNILNNLRTFFLTFLMVIALVGLFTACNSEQLDLGASGRNLEVHASKPQVVSKAFYTQDGVTRIITPSASNRKLAIVNTTIVNRSSTVIPISVDHDAAKLGDRRGKIAEAVAPFERSRNSGG